MRIHGDTWGYIGIREDTWDNTHLPPCGGRIVGMIGIHRGAQGHIGIHRDNRDHPLLR